MESEIKKLKYSSYGGRKKKYIKGIELEINVLDENNIELYYTISYEDIDVKFKGEIDSKPVSDLFKKIKKALDEENPELCNNDLDNTIVKLKINDNEIKEISERIDNLISKFTKILSRDTKITRIKESILETYSYK